MSDSPSRAYPARAWLPGDAHIVLAGGGTAGHLFPGLAVAERLRADGVRARISFSGSGRPLEAEQVARAGFEYLALPCRALPRRPREALAFLVENLAGYLAAERFVAEQRVDLVVALGGFASAAMARAALKRRLPLMALEQNVVPGRVTRWLAAKADVVCLAFAQAAERLPRRAPVVVTGNPLRGAFAVAAPANRQIIVLGGSGGARALNQQAPLALYHLREQLTGWRIVHQSGAAERAETQALYAKLALPAEVHAFIADMPNALAASAVAICRAGGGTLAELAAARLPAVLVPYPHAAADHQRRNAEVFAAGGGAILVDQAGQGRFDLRLADAAAELIANQPRRERMAWNLRRLARPHAAGDVAALVSEILATQRHVRRRAA